MMDWGAKIYGNSEDGILMVCTKDEVGAWKTAVRTEMENLKGR